GGVGVGAVVGSDGGGGGRGWVVEGLPVAVLSYGVAGPAEECFPLEEFRNCSNAALRREGARILQLGPSDGYPPLKEVLVQLLHGEGLPVRDENLLITDGCQQALDLLSKAFLRPGDAGVLENPTYPAAIAIFTV